MQCCLRNPMPHQSLWPNPESFADQRRVPFACFHPAMPEWILPKGTGGRGVWGSTADQSPGLQKDKQPDPTIRETSSTSAGPRLIWSGNWW